MALIEIEGLSHNFGDKKILDDTSFVLNAGEKVCLTGINGAGKSSLLKIIIGELFPDKGNISINKRTTIGWLDQHANINKNYNIKEYLSEAYKSLFDTEKKLNEINKALASETNQNKLNKLLKSSGDLFEYLVENDFYAIDSEIQKVCAGLGITQYGLDTSVSTLSGGQRAKVMLAKLLLENPDIVILDEPTNFLDTSHIDWLEKFIKNSNKSFVIVSHDNDFVNHVATVICDIDNLKIQRYVGDLNHAKELKEAKRIQYEKAFDSQQKEIKKLEEYIAKNKVRASTARMAQSRQKRLDKMDLLEKPSEQIKPDFSFMEKQFAGRLMLKVDKLEVGYSKPLLKPISFELNYGDIIAITGFNGIGKTTLLKTICGIIPNLSGYVDLCKNVIIGYYEQENNFNDIQGTPLDYINNAFPKLGDKKARAYLSHAGLNSVNQKKQIKLLSGGEQSKIKICSLTIKPSNLLILDEPTNHLDVFAVKRLSEAIKEFNGGVILVSHSREFVKSVATKIISLEDLIQ